MIRSGWRFVWLIVLLTTSARAEPSLEELLSGLGVDRAALDELASADLLQANPPQQMALVKLQSAVIRSQPWGDVAWSPRALPQAKSEIAPDTPRLARVEIRGAARHVQRVPLAAEMAESLGFAEYFVCQVQLESNQSATVIALQVPAAWIAAPALNESTLVRGVLLAAGDGELGPRIVAEQVGWFPETEAARAGFDHALLDHVQQRQPLRAHEREAFYQLLAAAEHDREAGDHKRLTPIVGLFNQPEQNVAARVRLQGLARRITRIEIDDPQTISRYGFDHYYQLELFTDDSQNNPLVCCLRRLPAGLPETGPTHESLMLQGFFLKVWAYQPQADLEPRRAPRKRLAPLILAGGASRLIVEPNPSDAWTQWVSLAAIGLLVAVIAAVTWGWQRADRRARGRLAAFERR